MPILQDQKMYLSVYHRNNLHNQLRLTIDNDVLLLMNGWICSKTHLIALKIDRYSKYVQIAV